MREEFESSDRQDVEYDIEKEILVSSVVSHLAKKALPSGCSNASPLNQAGTSSASC